MHGGKRTVTVAAAVVLALTMVAGPVGAATGPAAPTSVGSDAEPPAAADAAGSGGTTATQEGDRPDPPKDVLGWESVNGTGLWHNESIVVDRSDGLNVTELDRVVARAMARVEFIRELEFERTVPVDVISRATFSNRTARRYSNVSTEDRLHQNVKFEALFMIGENTDAVAQQQSNTASGVLGYYSPAQKRIVIVSENTTTPKIDEITLSQELFHALQDQRFNISRYNQTTEELHNARDGIIEGDGNYVDYLYGQRCGDEWTCLQPEESGGGGGGGDRHVGLLILSLAPYSDGPPFVQSIKQQGGWEAVNRVYDDPPASTEQLIHPEKYGQDRPANVSIEHTPSGEWRVLDLDNGSVNYAQFGEAGIFAMFWYPSYQSRSDQVVPYDIFDDPKPGLYDYDHPYSAGWDGDKLVPYVTNDSAETNETGYVWKTVWDSPKDAEEFVTGYRELLEYRNAEAVPGYENVFRIEEGGPGFYEFGDAFYVNRSGTTVTVVNAPTLADLSKVRATAPNVTAADLEATTTTTTTTATTTAGTEATTTADTATTDADTGTDAETTGGGSGDSQPQPGFGALVAVAVLAAVAAALARRRRN